MINLDHHHMSFADSVKAGQTTRREPTAPSAARIRPRTTGGRILPGSAPAGTRGSAAGELMLIPSGGEEAPLVLVVDDQRTTRIACSAYLAYLGYRVEHASSTVEALGKLTRDTSVVVLKMLLPDGDGLAALEMIRTRFPRIKVVMISARDQAISARAAMKLGAFEYLAKPVRPNDLEASVARAVQIQASRKAARLQAA